MTRRLQPKPKDRRKVPIPADLRDSLREVFELIEEGRRDPDISLNYGDAIQIGAVCGGRYGKKPRPYVLTYYADRKPRGERWYLALHRTEVEDIGDGRMTEITLYCCLSPECGAKFREADQHCDCDWVEDPNFGTFGFPAAIERLAQRGVDGFSEQSTRDDVIAKLGPPEKAGGDVTGRFGYINPWITYRRDDCQLRFEFGKDRRIANVTVMDRDWEPGK